VKPYLQQQLAGITDMAIGLPIVREYLQARILEGLQQSGAFLCLAFHGGTSLRFLYNIPRYSEDLDFAVELRSEQFDFHRYLSTIQRNLSAENYTVEVRAQKEQPVVNKAFIRFRGLLYDLGLSPYPDQVVAIKLEIDTNPPRHAVSETTLLRRHVDLHLRHHDRASLLAGKLQAVLNRTYVKGRDWYDLWWYLKQPDWPLPNFAYLNSGLQQAGSLLPEVSEENWKRILHERTQALNWSVAFHDVEPFIIDIDSQPEFNKERLLELLNEDKF
jgi:predicted nucleotidyltransferase component of viral defense system